MLCPQLRKLPWLWILCQETLPKMTWPLLYWALFSHSLLINSFGLKSNSLKHITSSSALFLSSICFYFNKHSNIVLLTKSILIPFLYLIFHSFRLHPISTFFGAVSEFGLGSFVFSPSLWPYAYFPVTSAQTDIWFWWKIVSFGALVAKMDKYCCRNRLILEKWFLSSKRLVNFSLSSIPG